MDSMLRQVGEPPHHPPAPSKASDERSADQSPDDAPVVIPSDHPIVLFDGSCFFCNRAIRFIIERDPQRIFRFASFESATGVQLLARLAVDPASTDSVVLIDGDRHWLRSDAVLEITGRLSAAWPMLRIFVVVPRPLRDWGYRIVAKHRHRLFGRQDSCTLPSDDLRSRFLPPPE